MFDKVNEDFKALVKDESVSIHWDEKLLQERRDFTAFLHIAVFLSHRNGTKLLATTSLEKRTANIKLKQLKAS